MNFALVVVHAFGAHAIGDRITDEAECASVLASSHAADVVRVAAETPNATPQEG